MYVCICVYIYIHRPGQYRGSHILPVGSMRATLALGPLGSIGLGQNAGCWTGGALPAGSRMGLLFERVRLPSRALGLLLP